ncbi:electron transport complex subunit RsxE [Caproicibacterium lactatifermentans]|jgi:electron transport complex protein RnfE|uniref:electron transport complex subunit RsxE n=1 Tax=Caproicibacterium lactatifermentans TaxID=2666138 RepID=UPI003D8A4118
MAEGKEKTSLWHEFTKGLIKENPVLRLVLGCCSTLALSTAVSNSIGMGIATTFVLVCSNAVISALRHVIPDKVRIPCYIVVIAGFVSVVQMLIEAFSPALKDALGIYLPLIVVNCIILGRAEGFANKHKVLPSIMDGLGMGLGFTFTLLVMGTIREIIGSGTFFGMQVTPSMYPGIIIFLLPPGGFFVFGMLMAVANRITEHHGGKPVEDINCACCPMAVACGHVEVGSKQPSEKCERNGSSAQNKFLRGSVPPLQDDTQPKDGDTK